MKGLRHPFAFDADQHFDTKGVGSWPHYGSNLLLYNKQNSSQMPAICLGRDGQFWNWLEHKMSMKGRIAVYKQFTRWRPRQKTLLWMSVILGSFNPLSPDISNGNRTEWSPIRSVIIWVINKIGWSHSKSPICLTMSMITDRIGWHKVLLPTNNNYIKIGDTLGYF